jgi:hypothetical protein
LDLLIAAFAVFKAIHAGIFVQARFTIAADQLTIGGGNDVFAGTAGQAEQAAGSRRREAFFSWYIPE